MNAIVTRISEIIKHSRLNDRQFEIKIGKATGYINSLKKRNSFPSSEVILDIVKSFPEYSLNWIMTGKGSMLKTEELSLVEDAESTYVKNSSDLIKSLNSHIIDIVRDEIEEHLKPINEDMVILLKRSMNQSAVKQSKKKEEGR